MKPSLEKSKTTKVHHISHHALVKEDVLTNKVRVVMDGNAKVSAEATNVCILVQA